MDSQEDRSSVQVAKCEKAGPLTFPEGFGGHRRQDPVSVVKLPVLGHWVVSRQLRRGLSQERREPADLPRPRRIVS